MEKITLSVEGMACGHCEITIQDAIRRLPGVKKARANRRKKEVVTEYDLALVSPEQIKSAIDATGYRVVE